VQVNEMLLDAARRIDVPALLVRGRLSDVVTPEGAQEFLDAVPGAEFVDVTGAGHMVAGDRNDAFNGAVLAFLDEVVG
jgi:pimeloyl-ACP methyl ester carboxylesterase